MTRRKRASTVERAPRPVRELPVRANLDFERKRAKVLLEEVRGRDPEALERFGAWHPDYRRAGALGESSAELRLADAQLVIAREYGFSSWPRLVTYFRDLEREGASDPAGPVHGEDFYASSAATLLRQHAERRAWAGRTLAAFVPRFYGKSVDEVFASSITEDDARLAVARQYRCTSWKQLRERTAATREFRERQMGDIWDREKRPRVRISRAIQNNDLATIAAIIAEHPELLHPSEEAEQSGDTLAYVALLTELRQRTREARYVTDWLVSRGVDIAPTLNRMLLRWRGAAAEEVQYLLDRGADPSWVPPNGITVLEHALIRYMNGDAVDLIARRVTPPRALWIAAGLGDVDTMRSFFDRKGRLTSEAYHARAAFGLIGSVNIPSLPEPDDIEILFEAAAVALLSDRAVSITFLIDRGLPVDYMEWGTPLVNSAVMMGRVATVECLVKRGADLDIRGWRPNSTARELARDGFLRDPEAPAARRILALCDAREPEQVIAEADELRKEPQAAPGLVTAFELAGDDAARLNQSEIGVEHLLIGLSRTSPTLPLGFLASHGADLGRLRKLIGARLLAPEDRVARPKLPFDAASRAAIERAIALARERRSDTVNTLRLLHALIESGGRVATLLQSLGLRPTITDALKKA